MNESGKHWMGDVIFRTEKNYYLLSGFSFSDNPFLIFYTATIVVNLRCINLL